MTMASSRAMNEIETSVLIVGAGPVGLGLAVELGWRGINCIVVEQSDGKLLLPRASGISVRSMEFCRRWGIAEQILNGGFPTDYRLDTIYCTSVTGHTLERHPNPPIREQEALPFSPVNKHRLPQHMFDPILERAASSCASVSLRRCCRLVGFEEVADGVLAYVEQTAPEDYQFDRADRSVRRSRVALAAGGFIVRALYMVACDGVMSGVRDALEIGIDGTGPGGESVLGYSVSALIRVPHLG